MTRVYVVGNSVADLTLSVRRSPRPGESVLADSIARAPGGKGLNQAVAARRAGADVAFVSAIGTDATGVEIEAALSRERFSDLRLLKLPLATDVSILTVTADGENSIVTTVGCTQASHATELTNCLRDLQPGDYALLQGNLSSGSTKTIVDFARARGGKVIVNAAPWHWDGTEILEKCDGVIANEGEICDISSMRDVEFAATWLQSRGPEWVIVTLGARGCLLASKEGVVVVEGKPVKAKDTSGAGDVFSGVLVASIALGKPLRTAIDAAQKAASLTVERSGTYTAIPSVAELRDIVGTA
ncbi:ribokinase [Paraburkholderia xenovorans]|uniref:ribokinase n=1 Tax=Paraburkholderia xenovorans TaxID=36873 RepID=UPI0038BA6DD6